jgi:hypothetical protein
MRNPILRPIGFVSLALLCVVFSGCRLMHPSEAFIGPGFEPKNVFLASSALPADVKRVAVLPLTADKRIAALRDGCEILAPVLNSELIKTRRFEVERINPEAVRLATGRPEWTGEEALPDDFFQKLRDASGCDAVLFCQLTAFRAYAPLTVGWRMKLVDARSRQILWSADEIFDAGEETVRNGARRYQIEQLQSVRSDGQWLVENAPRYFGQYTIATLFETFPSR